MAEDWKPYEVIPQQPRKTEMQVLCLGLSRTSTMSLYTALNKLGYNSYHMVEASLDSANDSLIHWDEAINAKYFGRGEPYQGQDFEKMLWRYDAVTDIPCILFVDELLAAYPNAKVVITTRDVQGWLRSMENSFYTLLSWKRWKILEVIDTRHTRHYIPILRNTLQVWTKNDWQNRDKLKKGFADHYAHVRSVVPKENLLEFHSSQGWEPLCKHLGKPVPDEPFPKLNEGSFVVDIHYLLFWGRLILMLSGWAKVVLPVAIAVGILRWYR